jgi:hypothetical protein
MLHVVKIFSAVWWPIIFNILSRVAGGTGNWLPVLRSNRRASLQWSYRHTTRLSQQVPAGRTKLPVLSMIHQVRLNRIGMHVCQFFFIVPLVASQPRQQVAWATRVWMNALVRTADLFHHEGHEEHEGVIKRIA